MEEFMRQNGRSKVKALFKEYSEEIGKMVENKEMTYKSQNGQKREDDKKYKMQGMIGYFPKNGEDHEQETSAEGFRCIHRARIDQEKMKNTIHFEENGERREERRIDSGHWYWKDYDGRNGLEVVRGKGGTDKGEQRQGHGMDMKNES
ncbi:hypothetical protein QAD02_016568 [Eretmocerus hayati]|uniref:Uncharacterized protein n=1 Tax=Eretmocerus hayati TaxID=131215 RepID=A0ACC2PBF6_9HYME|nr:hypothetical protein QAD02_016568 [Eretmocerus hayati]